MENQLLQNGNVYGTNIVGSQNNSFFMAKCWQKNKISEIFSQFGNDVPDEAIILMLLLVVLLVIGDVCVSERY